MLIMVISVSGSLVVIICVPAEFPQRPQGVPSYILGVKRVLMGAHVPSLKSNLLPVEYP